jgi:hypothetical protein
VRDSKRQRWRLGLALVLTLTPCSAQAAQPGVAPDAGDIRKDLDDLRNDTRKSFQAAQKTIEVLKEEVARLRKEVQDLRRGLPPTTRNARYGAAPGRSGSIRLVNAYVLPMTVIVNGTSYMLAPGETRLLRGQAPGTFTYEVPGVRDAVDRTLGANATFTIRIR